MRTRTMVGVALVLLGGCAGGRSVYYSHPTKTTFGDQMGDFGICRLQTGEEWGPRFERCMSERGYTVRVERD